MTVMLRPAKEKEVVYNNLENENYTVECNYVVKTWNN